MKKLADRWTEYRRIQAELTASHSLNDVNWGKEYALDRIIDDIEKGSPPSRSNAERYIKTGDRKNRHRRSLLRKLRTDLEEVPQDLMPSIEAAVLLHELMEKIAHNELVLVLKVVEGHTYRDLALKYEISVPTLRQRVSRTRSRARRIIDGD